MFLNLGSDVIDLSANSRMSGGLHREIILRSGNSARIHLGNIPTLKMGLKLAGGDPQSANPRHLLGQTKQSPGLQDILLVATEMEQDIS